MENVEVRWRMRKLYSFVGIAICLFLLAGCTEKQVLEKPPLVWQTENEAGTVFDRPITLVSFGDDWQDSSGDIFAQQVEEDIWLLMQYRGEEHQTEETMVCLCDMGKGQIIKQLLLPGHQYVSVREDKIIFWQDKEVYWMDKALKQEGARISLPDFLFEEMSKDGKDYGVASLDISSDFQHIVYSCRVRGINLYHPATGENKLLIADDQPPFWYDVDFDWWMSPSGPFFLPDNEKIVFQNGYGFWVIDLDGNILWQVDSGDMDDIWGCFWNFQKPESIPRFHEDYDSRPFSFWLEELNLLNNTITEKRKIPAALQGDNFPDNMGGVVYNENYFAYVCTRISDSSAEEKKPGQYIIAYDFATLTPRIAIEAAEGRLSLSAITDDNKILFQWESDDTADFINGLTESIE